MKVRLKMKNRSYRSYRYNINRPRPRHGHKYIKYKMCFSLMMAVCIKQHLSNILSWVASKKVSLRQSWKNVAYKKPCVSLNSGLWSNLLRKTAITTTFYFPEEASIGMRKK